MTFTLVHIIAGLTAIVAGTVALSAAKGGTLHRKAGLVFVATMAVMASLGAMIAATRLHQSFQIFNVMAGLFTVYLVGTALLTVHEHRRWLDVVAAAVAFAMVVFCYGLAARSLAAPKFAWFPAIPAIIFGSVALLATLGDVRMIRAGGIQGKSRIVRHLWRMCTAMFIATGSFFAGQQKVFPVEYQGAALAFGPMLAVLATMIYWWVKVRLGRWPARARRRDETPPSLTPTSA